MCGIVGYVGQRSAVDVVMGGLRRLEYRGYDSGGVAVVGADGLSSAKKAGKLVNLDAELAERPLPDAVRMRMTLDGYGPVEQLFLVGGG